ncbi:MAG TPA: ABC transporter ATP-binding protein, partial [Candidatus Limnocylindrales bacterium]|nr:ABC transporter ATP-binding protein [Candidatus Limnocylindrales bacterium]
MSLALLGARYRYAGAARWALAGVDLELEQGEVVGVVGASEAGKSTLGLVVAGLAPVVIHGRLEGSVTIDGRATAELAPHELATRCAILFQDPRAQLSGTARTVWEEVAFGPRNLGLDVAAIAARVERCLAAVGIEDLAARAPARLS